MILKGFLISILSIIVPAQSKHNHKPVRTVHYVNIKKYTGKWYEVARINTWFEKDGKEATATYELLEDGSVYVLNECNVYKNGKVEHKKAEAIAKVVDKTTNAKLKVDFTPDWLPDVLKEFAQGDYWIIDLDEINYSYAVVAGPTRDYLWILSRTPTMDLDLFGEILSRCAEQGFDVNKITLDYQR